MSLVRKTGCKKSVYVCKGVEKNKPEIFLPHNKPEKSYFCCFVNILMHEKDKQKHIIVLLDIVVL